MNMRFLTAGLVMLACSGVTAAEREETDKNQDTEVATIFYDPERRVADVEEARFGVASSDRLIMGTDFREMPVALEYGRAIAAATDSDSRLQATIRLAKQLFDSASWPGVTDDRALYWVRLLMRGMARSGWTGASEQEASQLIAALEWHSRGMTIATRVQDLHADDVDRLVVMTGFDPFFLDVDIAQSNPSGLTALNLDGQRFDVDGETVLIVSAIFPVRFQDFDDGLVERFVAEAVAVQPDLLLTISMGREGFDLERFPGLRRSATAPDNRNVLTGASADKPIKAQLDGAAIDGPEFVEFSLPAGAMTACESGPFEVHDNRTVTTLEAGQFEADSLAQLDGQTAVEGSGGGYLSNEISYRLLRSLQSKGSTIPAGHLHTPRVAGFEPETEQVIVRQIRELIVCAIQGLKRESLARAE